MKVSDEDETRDLVLTLLFKISSETMDERHIEIRPGNLTDPGRDVLLPRPEIRESHNKSTH